jgi:hypothetical protein
MSTISPDTDYRIYTTRLKIMQTTLETPATETQSEKSIDFGSGRYSPLMRESFNDAKRLFKLDTKAAEKLARQIGSDFGAAMRQDGIEAKASIGRKVSKNGEVSLKDASKVKCAETFALLAMRAMAYMNEASQFGLVSGTTKWALGEQLEEYFLGL